jgi:hypothetical protein
MSLIEKIDEMIRECSLPGGCDCLSDSINSAKRKLLREIKQLILSEQKEPHTIGDKIRENNESLAEVIHNSCWCDYCDYYEKKCDGRHGTKNMDCKQGILEHLNQPYTES